jgi:hypothetical protein
LGKAQKKYQLGVEGEQLISLDEFQPSLRFVRVGGIRASVIVRWQHPELSVGLLVDGWRIGSLVEVVQSSLSW